MTTGVIARGTIARQEMRMRIGGIGRGNAIERLHEIGLHARKPLVHHDAASRMRQNNRCQSIGHRTTLDGGMHIFCDIDELVGRRR